MEYTPDKWVMLKMVYESETIYKILASWYGGYLYGDSWKLNSGVTGVIDTGRYLVFTGHSGSTYRVHKDAYGMNFYTSTVLAAWEEDDSGVEIEVLPADTDFLTLDYDLV